MKLDDITEESLLANKSIRSFFVKPQWYFSYADMNGEFMGAFQNVNTTFFEGVEFISFSDIFLRVYTMKPLSDFERAIKTALNHNQEDHKK